MWRARRARRASGVGCLAILRPEGDLPGCGGSRLSLGPSISTHSLTLSLSTVYFLLCFVASEAPPVSFWEWRIGFGQHGQHAQHAQHAQQICDGFKIFGWLALGRPRSVSTWGQLNMTLIEKSNPWLLRLPRRSHATRCNTPGFRSHSPRQAS